MSQDQPTKYNASSGITWGVIGLAVGTGAWALFSLEGRATTLNAEQRIGGILTEGMIRGGLPLAAIGYLFGLRRKGGRVSRLALIAIFTVAGAILGSYAGVLVADALYPKRHNNSGDTIEQKRSGTLCEIWFMLGGAVLGAVATDTVLRGKGLATVKPTKEPSGNWDDLTE